MAPYYVQPSRGGFPSQGVPNGSLPPLLSPFGKRNFSASPCDLTTLDSPVGAAPGHNYAGAEGWKKLRNMRSRTPSRRSSADVNEQTRRRTPSRRSSMDMNALSHMSGRCCTSSTTRHTTAVDTTSLAADRKSMDGHRAPQLERSRSYRNISQEPPQRRRSSNRSDSSGALVPTSTQRRSSTSNTGPGTPDFSCSRQGASHSVTGVNSQAQNTTSPGRRLERIDAMRRASEQSHRAPSKTVSMIALPVKSALKRATDEGGNPEFSPSRRSGQEDPRYVSALISCCRHDDKYHSLITH